MKPEERKKRSKTSLIVGFILSIVTALVWMLIASISNLAIQYTHLYFFVAFSAASGLGFVFLCYFEKVKATFHRILSGMMLFFIAVIFIIPAIGHFLYFRSASYIPFAVGAYILTLIIWCIREVYWQSKAIETTKFMQKEFTEHETYIEMRDPVKTELKERPVFIGSEILEKFFGLIGFLGISSGAIIGVFGGEIVGEGAMLTLISTIFTLFSFKFLGRLSAGAYTTYRIWKLERQTGKPVYLSND